MAAPDVNVPSHVKEMRLTNKPVLCIYIVQMSTAEIKDVFDDMYSDVRNRLCTQ